MTDFAYQAGLRRIEWTITPPRRRTIVFKRSNRLFPVQFPWMAWGLATQRGYRRRCVAFGSPEKITEKSIVQPLVLPGCFYHGPVCLGLKTYQLLKNNTPETAFFLTSFTPFSIHPVYEKEFPLMPRDMMPDYYAPVPDPGLEDKFARFSLERRSWDLIEYGWD